MLAAAWFHARLPIGTVEAKLVRERILHENGQQRLTKNTSERIHVETRPTAVRRAAAGEEY